MITSSGPMCDICGKYILGLKSMFGLEDDERVNMFKVKGIKESLCCHNECKELAIKAGNDNDWKQLPKSGNLYQVFKKASDDLTQNKKGV